MSHNVTTTIAIDRYCEVRHRMPDAVHPEGTEYVKDLSELVNEFDLFVLDGFGVLNVGASPVDGAADRIKQLRAAGRTVVVLTNGATSPAQKSVDKYAGWDMAFDDVTLVSSRDALIQGLEEYKHDKLQWGVAATSFARIDEFPVACELLEDDDAVYEACDGFVLLSSLDWNDARQARLIKALKKKPRPVLVGNPDIVAPHPDGLSLEPGWYAHALADELPIKPVFYGKPFGNAFDAVTQRFPDFDPQRIAMVGDSPHTDILGGAAAGWRTVLIQKHGLCKSHDLESVFTQSGIRPDFVAATT